MNLVGLLFGCILGFSSHSAWADSKTIINKKTVKLSVDLSQTVVRSVNKGYVTRDVVKILVPGLAAHTMMNHRDEGEVSPALTTFEANKVEDIVGNNPTVEMHDVEITLSKYLFPFPASQTCAVWLKEDIRTTVRGFEFVHSGTSQLPDRHIDDCQ